MTVTQTVMVKGAAAQLTDLAAARALGPGGDRLVRLAEVASRALTPGVPAATAC